MPKPHSEPAYEQLEQHFGKIGRLQDALAILQWDTETMMPAGAVDARAEQLAAMEGMIHRLITDPALAELFETAETTAPEDPWQKANLVEMQRRWIHERALEPELVEALSRATTDCVACWRQARPQNDFAAVRPKLETLLSLTRQKAAAKAEALGLTPYEALLDEYEPNGRTSEIDRVFDQLASFLPDLIDRVIDAQAKAPRPKPLKGPFDTDKQQELGRRLMEFDRLRLRTRPPRHQPPSVLRRRARRRSHYDPLYRSRLHAQHDGCRARDRTRAV
jgi:carboxypeptidase Taq